MCKIYDVFYYLLPIVMYLLVQFWEEEDLKKVCKANQSKKAQWECFEK